MKMIVPAVLIAALAGCAGQTNYIPGAPLQNYSNVKVINKSREATWNASVPQLGKQFFVINNLDKSSGFINLSYAGDPESYVDCKQ